MEAAIRSLRLGAHDYLTKPLSNREELILAAERAIHTKRLRDANRRLIERLERLSRTDALTGALNRMASDEALAREAARADRYGAPFGLILLDLDHFKRVNDVHGHEGGDRVLRHFASVVGSALRQCDLFYRYGGEEFAVLLPQTGLAGAPSTSARVVRAVAQRRLRLMGTELQVTCSAGVAACCRCRTQSVAPRGPTVYRAWSAGARAGSA